jgi:hypothetical protein
MRVPSKNSPNWAWPLVKRQTGSWRAWRPRGQWSWCWKIREIAEIVTDLLSAAAGSGLLVLNGAVLAFAVLAEGAA